jgi:exosortase family protein XrtM
MNKTKNFAFKWQEWLQLLLFVGCYVLFDYAYFKIPDDLFINVIYYRGVVTICADLINFMAPLEHVLPHQNHLLSSKADLEIVRGCDGAGVLFLLLSAILVFPAKLSRKLLGLILAVGLVYTVNLLRIELLYFVIAYHHAWFSLVHTYLAPTLMVLVACAYFAWWALGAADKSYEPA